LEGRKFVDDESLVGAGRGGSLGVALVEGIRELMNGCHNAGLVLCGGHGLRQDGEGEYEEHSAHVDALQVS
jgi:hypothetical protein